MRYLRSSWHQPYGEGDEHEGAGFGDGDGEATGEIEGTLVWANAPRRRDDGVWTPNLRGFLTTPGGDEILISIHGQSIREETPGQRRAVTARVELTTEAEAYRWLNTLFCVGEGEIDEQRGHWWLEVFGCINEQAQGPPAIGAEPPERFRQLGGEAK